MIKNRLGASVVNSVPSGSLITDVEFYSELVDAYNAEKGTTYDYTHNFTEAELASLENLTLDEQGPNYHGHSVDSLDGLSYLTGLKNLTLKNMSVTTIDLSHNTALINLTIDSVSIVELNLKNNTSLSNLSLNVPTLYKLILANTNLSNISLSKPTTSGLIAVNREKDISYLIGISSQDETLKDNSFQIICDKYDLALNESTTCVLKGKPIVNTTAVAFALLQNNQNITLSNFQKITTINGNKESNANKYVLYGNVPVGEFDIISFTVTGTSNGTTKLSLGDFSEENELGYVEDSATADPIKPDEEISKTFSVGKYVITNASDEEVTSGYLKTNYKLKIVNSNGQYETAYDIAVLGDVIADGYVNVRDIGTAYKYISRSPSDYSGLTAAQILALDRNSDGLKNGADILEIYRDKR